MKWCLSSRQSEEYLLKADEIKVQYRDRKFIYDIPEKYPNATVILVLPFDPATVVDWKEISTFNVYMEHRFILCLTHLNDYQKCQEAGIKFYYGFPASNFYELNCMKKLGVCYVRLAGAPAFNLSVAKNIGIPIRVVPNIANEFNWPDEDGVCGSWIRPEDLEYLEKYIDAVEFEDCDLQKEQALYRIYAIEKNWPGRVDMLISNITTEATNRLIEPGFGMFRANCGQKCQENKRCNYCYNLLYLANEERIEKLMEIQARSKEQSEEQKEEN